MLATTQRLLRSSLVDVLVGPHGIDRYLELIRPDITVHDARARVVGIRHQTDRSVTLGLRPNRAFTGFRAGQFLKVGVDIDGVRRTRTYSPACSEHRRDGLLELTVTVHPEGLVSRHLKSSLRTGDVVHLSNAGEGEFVLPRPRPPRIVLISGGSGVTPVLSMLRTLADENHDGEILFLHYARTGVDWLYREQVRALQSTLPRLSVRYLATREGDGHLSGEHVGELDGATFGAVCGPPALIDAAGSLWAAAGAADRLLSETFTPPQLKVPGASAEGTLHFVRSGAQAAIGSGTLLEQAEAAGLSPDFGCRMGICHTCTCRKRAGAVQNILTGEVSEEEDEDIQLCISVPAGDVTLDI